MMGGPYAEITKKELRKFLKDRGIRGPATIEEGIDALEEWDASHTWQEKAPWDSFLASLGRNPRIKYRADVLELERELYGLGYDFSEPREDEERVYDVLGGLAELYEKNKHRDFSRPVKRTSMGTMAYMDRPTMRTMGKPTMGSMGRPTMGTYGKGTCGTMAVAGQASKLLAKAKTGYKNAKSAVGDQYWKGVTEKVGDNLKSQHGNFIEQHKAHAREWAAALDNLTKDLKAALSALQKAEGLDNEDPKKEKKVSAAENKRDKVLAKMDKWLESHDDQPREKIGRSAEVALRKRIVDQLTHRHTIAQAKCSSHLSSAASRPKRSLRSSTRPSKRHWTTWKANTRPSPTRPLRRPRRSSQTPSRPPSPRVGPPSRCQTGRPTGFSRYKRKAHRCVIINMDDLVATMMRIRENAADFDYWGVLMDTANRAEKRQVEADYDVAKRWLLARYEQCKSSDLEDTIGSIMIKAEGGSAIQKLEGASLIAERWFAQNDALPQLPTRFYDMLEGKKVGVAIGLGGFKWQFRADCALDVIVHFAGDSTQALNDGFGTLFQKQEEGEVYEGSIVCHGRTVPVWEVYRNFVPCNHRSSDFLALLKARGAAEVEILCGVDGFYCEKLGNLAQAEQLPFIYMHGTADDHTLQRSAPGQTRVFTDRTRL